MTLSLKEKSETEYIIAKWSKVYHQLLSKFKDGELSEALKNQIMNIIEDLPRGSEQRYQAISTISDILQNTKTEQEIIQKLCQSFPNA